MSTKKKMIVSITSMCVVLLVAVVSVIAVWAATSASVKSNINITYTIEHLSGTMKMRVADRNKTTDSEITWTSLKTNNGAGVETLTFSGDGEVAGDFGLGSNFYSQEYTGIQPMTIVEVQMTNTSSTSYFAQLTSGKISYESGWTDTGNTNWIAEVYVVRDFFADGVGVVPAVSEYYQMYKDSSSEREVVSVEGGTTTEYEIKNDGIYCFYLCIVCNQQPNKAVDGKLTVNFAVDLHNAYAGE